MGEENALLSQLSTLHALVQEFGDPGSSWVSYFESVPYGFGRWGAAWVHWFTHPIIAFISSVCSALFNLPGLYHITYPIRLLFQYLGSGVAFADEAVRYLVKVSFLETIGKFLLHRYTFTVIIGLITAFNTSRSLSGNGIPSGARNSLVALVVSKEVCIFFLKSIVYSGFLHQICELNPSARSYLFVSNSMVIIISLIFWVAAIGFGGWAILHVSALKAAALLGIGGGGRGHVQEEPSYDNYDSHMGVGRGTPLQTQRPNERVGYGNGGADV